VTVENETQNGDPPKKYFTIKVDEEVLSNCRIELNTTATAIEAVDSGIKDLKADPEIKDLLGGISLILRSYGRIQNALLLSATEIPAVPDAPVSYAAAAKKGGGKSNAHNGDGQKQRKPSTRNQQEPGSFATHDSEDMREKDKKYYRFRDTIRDAERSTLVFGLNLGKNPIMDHETMSTRATLALGEKAAKVEKLTTSHPCETTREILDDATGMAEKIQFYGRQTKSYRNPKDPNSGAYCTLPVRYDFSDRDMRIRVEKILREKCDANCSTPYPLVVRECIKRVAAATKAVYPEAAVRVNVDAHNFCLRVGTKAKDQQKFYWIRKPVPLPTCALDTELKKLPRDFDFEITLIPGENGGATKNNEQIDTTDNATPMEGTNAV